MNRKSGSSISRREFARRAAIVSAASLVTTANLNLHAGVAEPVPQQPSDTPGLSAESRAEAEARYQTILGVYGSRFSDPQKTDLQRLCLQAQPSLDRLRAYSVENGDGPALYLKPLVEREKKSELATTAHMASQTTKKP
jgi:hypothetical protein